MKKFLFIPVLLSTLALTGCPQSQTDKLAVASDTVAHALTDTDAAIDLAMSSGILPVAQGQTIESDVAKVAITGLALDAAISANNGATPGVQLNNFLTAFNTLVNEDVAGIKDAKTKLAIATILNGAQVAITVISGGK